MGFVLLAAYTADLTQRLTSTYGYTKIHDYKDLKDKTVGSLSTHKQALTRLGMDVKEYSYTYSDTLQIIEDLKDGKIDAAIIE